MSKPTPDTICAIATATGRSGIGIIRVSGPGVPKLCAEILGFVPPDRHASFCDFLDKNGQVIDRGIALFFEAPHSFTGEHVLELQGHGGAQILSLLLERVTELGSRLASPGEFSERAFLNDKMDLLQAEAIAALIDAQSRQAALSAVRTMQGAFSAEVNALLENLITVRVHVEASIDFVDEDIDILSESNVSDRLRSCAEDLLQILARATQGAILKEGMQVVITGLPNAGKSSLLNALSGIESAIVTNIPGTTRDILKEEILIDGMPVHVTDTAGIRDVESVVEQEGIKRARSAVARADRILLVVDATSSELTDVESIMSILGEDGVDSLSPITSIVFNKIDLLSLNRPTAENVNFRGFPVPVINLSAKDGQGLAQLREHLKDCVGFRSAEEGTYMARKRHLDALQDAEKHLQSAMSGVNKRLHLELVAEDLRLAQLALATITGRFSSDDLLGEIFSSFCIGK